jgi:tungstate transport system substrate-binding protein
LVVRQAGGASGGGTSLTREGKKLLAHMQSLQREVQGQLAALFGESEPQETGQLVLASTMEPVVTGLLDVLEQAYFIDTRITVRHVAAGSGQALDMARAGRVDVLLTHAPILEEAFVSEGWGVFRMPVMKNDYVLVGPPDDPAHASAAVSALQALQCIAAAGAPFVSRGDQSGTHLHEKKLWQLAKIEPYSSSWYMEARNILGNYGVLQKAADHGGYTLLDRASFVTGYDGSGLIIIHEGDPTLQNVFSAIPVSRAKAAVNQRQAEDFARWLVSQKAKELIRHFGMQQYGFSLFTPWENGLVGIDEEAAL